MNKLIISKKTTTLLKHLSGDEEEEDKLLTSYNNMADRKCVGALLLPTSVCKQHKGPSKQDSNIA